MNKVQTLNNLKKGNKAIVKTLLTTGTMRRRLQELGLIEGTEVKCLQKSPFGDPTAYVVRGAVIALRSEDASNIVICEKSNERRKFFEQN